MLSAGGLVVSCQAREDNPLHGPGFMAAMAQAAGADYIATTLSGYVGDGPAPPGPDLTLLAALLRQCRVPVVAEGRYDTPALAAEAFALGAHAVVVGTAITNPREITRRFVS